MTGKGTTPNKGRPAPAARDFLAVRTGRWSLQITPQTPRGWHALLWWVFALLAPLIPLVALAWKVDNTPREIWLIVALVPLLAVNGLTIWAMVRWMLARADVITGEDLAEMRRQRTERQGARGK